MSTLDRKWNRQNLCGDRSLHNMHYRLSLPFISILGATLSVLLLMPVVVFAAENPFVDFFENGFQKLAWTVVINLTGLLLGIGGAILDVSINNFVIGFGNTFLNTGVGLAVNQTWVIIRDFVNLGFIFGLVYIGFKMILGNDTSNTRRWLVNLIIAALLVNFSLLMTKVVVDFSNELSAQIAVGALGAKEKADGKYTSNVTSQVMNVMGLTEIFGLSNKKNTPAAVTGEGGWGYILGTGMLFMVTAFVFFAGGILLIIRFIALNLYMMLSPLMFIGWILPFLSDQMSKYWKGFLKRAFFAPIYLLFIYFGLQVLSGLKKSVDGFGDGFNNPKFSDALTGGSSGSASAALTAGTTITFFLLACGFMIAALMIADRMGADGADKAIKIGQNLRNRVQRFATQQTAGRGAQAVNWASEKTLSGYNRLDARLSQTQAGRFTRGAMTALTLGALNDKTVKGALGAGQNLSVAGSETNAQRRKRADERRKLQNDTLDKAQRRADNRANNAAANSTGNTPAEITARQDAQNAKRAIYRQKSNDEIAEMARTNRAQLIADAQYLTDGHTSYLESSGILRNDELQTVRNTRDSAPFADFENTFNSNTASVDNLNATMEMLNRTVSAYSKERIRDMDSNLRNSITFAGAASQTQFDEFMQSDASQAEKNAFRAARTAAMTRIAQTGSLIDPNSQGATSPGATNSNFQDAQRRRLFRNAQQAGALPAAVLGNANIASYLTPNIAEAFFNNNPSPSDLILVRDNIHNYITDPRTPASVTNTWTNWMNTTVIGRIFL